MTDRATLARIIATVLHHPSRLAHHFQPIWDLATGQLTGFEALARFPEAISPGVVWAYARSQGVVRDLDDLSLMRALEAGAHLPGLLFLNRSAPHFVAVDRQAQVEASIRMWRLTPQSVVFEVTEDAWDAEPAGARDASLRVKSLGCGVALDDAGAGQSTRERLLLLQPAYLKIDRPVVLAWARGEPRELLYWVRWGRELGARVVAEGVEDAGLASALRLVGVTHVQGYAFGRPEPGDYWTAERLERVRPA